MNVTRAARNPAMNLPDVPSEAVKRELARRRR